MPVLGPQTYAPVKAYLRRRGGGDAGVARRRRADRDRLEQAEGRRVGGLRRDVGADAGGGDVEGAVRLRPVQRGRLQPDGAHAGRHRIGLGVEARTASCGCSIRRSCAAAAIDKAARSHNPVARRAGQVHRRARAGGARRSARLAGVCRRRASGRRRAELLLEEGRRHARSASRSSARRCGSIPIPRYRDRAGGPVRRRRGCR